MWKNLCGRGPENILSPPIHPLARFVCLSLSIVTKLCSNFQVLLVHNCKYDPVTIKPSLVSIHLNFTIIAIIHRTISHCRAFGNDMLVCFILLSIGYLIGS